MICVFIILALIQEPGEKLIQLSTLLHSACKNTVILELERDLIQDCVLFLWETIRPAFSQLHTHHTNITRPLTSSRKGKEVIYVLFTCIVKLSMIILFDIVCWYSREVSRYGRVFEAMEVTYTHVWRVDTQIWMFSGILSFLCIS